MAPPPGPAPWAPPEPVLTVPYLGGLDGLRALAGPAHPNVVLLDWEQLSARCPGSCSYDDGIHRRPEGRRYDADLVVQASGL